MFLRAITFDYGGTLDGEASHWLDRFVALYRLAGEDIPFERVKEAFYRADDAAYADPAVRDAGLRPLMEMHVRVQLEALGRHDDALHTFLVDRFVALSQEAFAGSRRVLEKLAGRYRLGVISNFYGNVERILCDAGLASFFAVVVDSTRAGLAKPDPRVFQHAVAALGTEPGETLHVGDSYERDVVAAHAVGLRTAWLAGDRTSVGPFPRVEDFCVRTLCELTRVLETSQNGALP
jgi:putative hydrolase of the HAD superfamily